MMMPERPDNSLIHRLRPEAKLLVLFVCSIFLFVLTSPLALIWPAGAIVAITVLCCSPAFLQWLRAWPLLLTIAALGIWTFFARGLEETLVILLRLGALSLLATIVTATTTVGQFISTITRLVRPLEKLGVVNARDAGLVIGLVVRFVPEVQARYRSVVDAHRARGIGLKLSTIIVPIIIAVILSADEIANAIDARNIRDTQSRNN